MEPLFSVLSGTFSDALLRLEVIAMMIALSMGLAWACGINLYATLFAIGIMGITGLAELPDSLSLLENHAVVAVAGLLYVTDYFASRRYWNITSWDTIQAFINIPAGGLLAAGAITGANAIAVLGVGIAGAFLTFITYNSLLGAKEYLSDLAGSFSPLSVSVTKDIVLVAGLWAGFHLPMLLVTLLVVFVIYVYS